MKTYSLKSSRHNLVLSAHDGAVSSVRLFVEIEEADEEGNTRIETRIFDCELTRIQEKPNA